MQQPVDHPPIRRSSQWPAFALIALGWAVAWASLSLAGYLQQDQWPAAAFPFGLNRVLVVHLLCVLPLALWCGRWLTVLTGRGRASVFVGVAVGVVLAGASLIVAPSVALLWSDTTIGPRNALRLIWTWLLLLPWAIAAAAVYLRTASPAPTGERPALLAAVDGIIAALFAILAVIHIQQLSARQEALISHLAANQQSLRALQVSRQLAELGSGQILGRPTQEVVTGLSRQVEASRQQVAAPLPANTSLPQRLARVEHLHSLERFDEVERLLRAFDDDPRASLRLALVSEARHQYAQAADRYARTIEQLGKLPNPDAEQLRLLRIAVERRVNNLRRIGKNRQAEAELLAGLERWPQVQDALLMQLGFHYQLAGRIGEAIEYFQRAAVVNPRLQAQADATLKQLELQAEGCILRPTRGVTR